MNIARSHDRSVAQDCVAHVGVISKVCSVAAKTCRVAMVTLAILTFSTAPVFAQSGKPIRFIVPYAAGGAVDVYARVFATPMGKHLGRSIIIENAAGGGGNVGVARVSKSAPDGDTLLYHNMAMAVNPSLYKKLDYDPLTDFAHIGVASHSVMAVVARKDFPPQDMKSLIAYAKTNGDKVTFADGGAGGATNLCALLFMNAVGVKFTSVSYKGSAPAMNDVMGGQVDFLCDGTATAAQPINAGKVRAIGVTSRERVHTLPNVPSLHEQGLAGFELRPWTGIYAAPGTPRAVVDRLSAALRATLAEKEFVAQLEKLSLLPATNDQASPAGLQEHLKAEIEKWGAILKKAGIEQIN